MNILVTSIIDLEKTPYSRLHHFIEHLVKNKHKVTVISIKDNWKHKGQRQNRELMKKIDVRYVTNLNLGAIAQKILARVKINSILKDIDLDKIDVHLCYSSLILGNLVIMKLRKHGIKTVYDLADDLPEMIKTSPHIPRMLRGLGGKIGEGLLRSNLKMSDFITITANEFRKSMGVSKYEHKLLPNGVDTRRFKPKSYKKKRITVGYVGALREWVNLRPMLKAVQRLKAYKIRVLIVGGEEDLEQYKRYVKKLGIEKLVKFTGNVPYKEVPGHIAKMDICTIPFRKNPVTDGTCPLKLLEYMAMEKACICSKLNEIEHMVGNRVLYADTEDEWLKQISLLYQDPLLRENVGKRGRELVEENYNWKRICEDMEKILIENKR